MENNTESLHRTAMKLVQQSLVLREQGDEDKAETLLKQAFESELEAAMSLASRFDKEPARSILFRSAAALAIDCGKWNDAQKLIYFGLAGNVPAMIQQQFFELFEKLTKQPKGPYLRLTAMKKYMEPEEQERSSPQVKLFDQVVMTKDLPSRNIKSGDVGTVTEFSDEGKTVKVEFFTLGGSFLAELKLPVTSVKPVSPKMVQHVREIV